MTDRNVSRLLILFLIVSFQSFGQKYNVQNYTTKEGLSGQIVNGVFQDRSGYLWFATQSGVCFFNGRTFQPFEPSSDLVGIDAVGVIQDQKDKIWIATNANGVFVYDFKKIKNYNDKNGLPSNVVRSMFVDREDVLWILTSKGVSKVVNDKLQHLVDTKNLFKNGVLSMTQGKDGAFWFGTQGNGLVKLSNGKYTYFGEAEGVLDNYIFSLKSHGDSILLGTTNQGLLVLENGKISKLLITEIENEWISNVVVSGNALYIVSSAGLIEYYNPKNYTVINESNGIASNDLYFGAKDRENNIWLASGNGVSLLRNEKILSFDELSGLSDDKITSITSLKDGRLIVGTYGFGLNVLDKSGKVIQQIQHPELMNIKITSIAYFPFKQELWVGAEQSEGGIIILDSKNNSFKIKKAIRSIQGNVLNTITRIAADRKNQIWVGTFNAGLFCINTKDTIHYQKGKSFPSNEVYTFEIDENDNPWVSIYQKGIYVFNGTNFQAINKAKGVKDKIILSIAKDKKGNIYLGNKTEGLTIVTRDKTYSFKTNDGLLSNSIQSVVCDGNNVWVGSSLGLNKITFSPEFKLVKVETLNEKTGLLNSEIQQNALFLTKENVWIGSSTGLSSIPKVSKNRSLVKPLLELQSIKLYFEDVDWSKKDAEINKWGVPTKLLLGYKDNNLTFTFNALTSTRVQYAFILEGQDLDWTPYSDKNEVTFSNIAPGEYKFKVKAINNFGIESQVLVIPITIQSPYWETWWFRISIIVAIALLIIAFVRYRERRFKIQQAKLEVIVGERTKEAVSASERAENQKQLVEQKNKEILDSISYAKRIQTAMLPTVDYLHDKFKEIAIFYRPKDIVAGDFYWFEESDDFKMIAVADCTGHGVPGAMVSVVCYNALNRSVREYGLTDPGKILDKTREIILSELSKNDENVKDGMDISLVVLEKKSNKINWSGANNSLWLIPSGLKEITEIKADKQPIGAHIQSNSFTTHQMELKAGDTMVLFTDGYADQFGMNTGKKFKSANLKRLIAENVGDSMNSLEQQLITTFEDWKGSEEQVDDVCVIAIKVV